MIVKRNPIFQWLASIHDVWSLRRVQLFDMGHGRVGVAGCGGMMVQTRAATDTRILQTRSYSICGQQANETYSLRSGTGWSRGKRLCLGEL
jgi:hypothetical protein